MQLSLTCFFGASRCCAQPKPLVIRFLAQTFNRFPTQEQYKEWFAEAGFADVQTRLISNPWNAQQYAMAICGTKTPGTPQPARRLPEPASSQSMLRKAAYLPLALGRFVLAMGAFAIVGPVQILKASIGMRRLKAQGAQ